MISEERHRGLDKDKVYEGVVGHNAMKARYVRLLGYFVYSLPLGLLYAFPVFKVGSADVTMK